MNTKPILDYLEFCLTSHCNLCCKGCALFSPLATPTFLDITQHEKDMSRLHTLFDNINLIRLLGGEPLLNPDIIQIIALTKEYFPSSSLHILTNGTLLSKMDDFFWKNLRLYNVEIDISLYPPFFNQELKLKTLCKNNAIPCHITHKTHFKRVLNLNGNSNATEAFSQCVFKVSTFLNNGKISACSLPSTAHIFNDYFNMHICEEGTLDIHASHIQGQDILEFLHTPTKTCKYCSLTPVKYNWTSPCSKTPSEWNV